MRLNDNVVINKYNRDRHLTLFENDNFKAFGLPFYNERFKKQEFGKVFDNVLII